MGKQKIVISERDNIAVLFDDDKAVEFIINRGDVLLGDVYLAQVENILPSIDAAFVNVGTERMGFLHSSDVQGRGDLKSRLQPKQNLVVQVMKEPTGHKGPRVTTNIAMPGRFLVLMPESKGISISRKIAEQKERSRLKSILSLTKPPGVGVIIRTEAEGQADAEIQDDFETLIERWQQIVAMADTAQPPALLYRDQDLLYRVIREMVTEDVKEIVVDTQFGQQRANQLLQNWSIEHPVKVTLYSGPNSIMLGAGIDKEIKQALQTRVPLPSGGYLYIQPTEALTVIDVNSGKFTSLASQAETIRLTNLEAAKEIARQLRLRNIGGMIIVDFIDMESRANQLSVLEFFENELASDKAKPQIGQLSDLGLVEMTRHRQGQSLSEIFTKKCQSCSGNGLILEEMNWSTGSGDPRSQRSKMPVKYQRPQGGGGGDRQQQGRGEGGGGNNQRQQLAKAGAQTLRRFIDPKAGEPLREGFLQLSKAEKDRQDKLATEQMTFEQLFAHRLLKKLGIRLAHAVKLALTPLEINAILVRINPKSNDIFTLVNAIEGSAYMPSMDNDFEDGMDGEGAYNGNDGADMLGEDPVDDDLPVSDKPSSGRKPFAQRNTEVADEDDADESVEVEPFAPTASVAVQDRPLLDMSEFESVDDDDDASEVEGELVTDDDASPESVATAVRRRGRPPTKSRLKVSADAVASDEEGSGPKPRRGRPPKKKSD